jgi:hypothetical protein
VIERARHGQPACVGEGKLSSTLYCTATAALAFCTSPVVLTCPLYFQCRLNLHARPPALLKCYVMLLFVEFEQRSTSVQQRCASSPVEELIYPAAHAGQCNLPCPSSSGQGEKFAGTGRAPAVPARALVFSGPGRSRLARTNPGTRQGTSLYGTRVHALYCRPPSDQLGGWVGLGPHVCPTPNWPQILIRQHQQAALFKVVPMSILSIRM